MAKKSNVFNDFILGAILFVIIQTVFMLGGYFIEKAKEMPITGIPSVIGMTLILIIGICFAKKGKEYVLLGSFAIAFLSPLILLLIVLFNAMAYTIPHIYYSIGYLTLLLLVVWGYFIIKIYRKSF